MERRDFPKILPIDGKEFKTAGGKWLATVRQYPASTTAERALLHLKIDSILISFQDTTCLCIQDSERSDT